MSTHAKLSPSTAHRWLRCPASVGFVERLRDEGKIAAESRSTFADEGTTAHEFAAKALESFNLGFDFDWSSIPDAVMAAHVRAYYDLVVSKVTGEGQLYIEHRMPLFYSPKDCGTSDAIVLTDEALYIIDLKYGAGVSVEANDNDQLAVYAESFVREQGLRDRLPPQFSVVPIIFQPRAREGAPVREWFTTLGELDAKATDIGAVARQIANQSDGKVARVAYCAGPKQCQFCPAKALCRTYADYCTYDVKTEFAHCDTPEVLDDPRDLSESEIARIAKVAVDGEFVKWLNAVADYALELRLAGKLADSGLKAVYSSPRRKWVDEDAAAKLLRNYLTIDEAQPRSVVSPSQAEKLLKPHNPSAKMLNKMETLITKPQGQPTLALADDKRQEIVPVIATSEFSDVAKPEEDLL